jgi:hypothetical protein
MAQSLIRLSVVASRRFGKAFLPETRRQEWQKFRNGGNQDSDFETGRWMARFVQDLGGISQGKLFSQGFQGRLEFSVFCNS